MIGSQALIGLSRATLPCPTADARVAARWSATPTTVRPTTVVAPPNHAAMCDADRIREAIDNLVSNAVKYSPIGGAIDLLVTRQDDGIVVEVRDQGAGLSPEDISRLFGRFQRLSAKPTAGETSTGLGLSIVKRIVDLHGGRIAVESAGPGKGATFKMTLPVT